MNQWLRKWLPYRWRPADPRLIESYRATFQSEHGALVLIDLIDSVYATVCESNDPYALAAHNARRRVVHEILMSLDIAENPRKYMPEVQSDAVV